MLPLLFLVYINDLFSSVQFSHIPPMTLNALNLIHKDQDTQQLQQDIESLVKWSEDWNLFFNTNKFMHLSFNTRSTTSYSVNGTPIVPTSTHRDLGITISSNLSWNEHYNSIYILAKAYCTLGLLRHMFSSTINIQIKISLYISLIRSQLLYCSQIWHPYLLCDIAALEQLQCRSTKFILND